jgi:hypothetical protein
MRRAIRKYEIKKWGALRIDRMEKLYSDVKPDELWKDVEGYNGNYHISSLGRARSTTHNARMLKPDINPQGYCRYNLSLNGKPVKQCVHRMVAQAFIPNPQNYPIVDHIDRDPSNNTIQNLRWVTSSMNAQNSERVENNCNIKYVTVVGGSARKPDGSYYTHQAYVVTIKREGKLFKRQFQDEQLAIAFRNQIRLEHDAFPTKEITPEPLKLTDADVDALLAELYP